MKFPGVNHFFHTPRSTRTSPDNSAGAAKLPRTQQSFSSGSSFGLSSLNSKSSFSTEASTSAGSSISGSSMAPRSSMGPREHQALKENALVRLMDQHESTDFTRDFIRKEDERPALLTPKMSFADNAEIQTAPGTPRQETAHSTEFTRDSIVEEDPRPAPSTKPKVSFADKAEVLTGSGTTHEANAKTRSTHRLSEPTMLPGAVEAFNQKHQAKIDTAATTLLNLVKKHPGKFDAKIEQGIVPNEAIPKTMFGRARLGKSAHSDIIHSFQVQQSKEHQALVREAAMNLKGLALSSTEAEALLQNIMQAPPLAPAGRPGSKEAAADPTPEQAIQAALAKLPERLHGDVMETYEGLGKVDPRQEALALAAEAREVVRERVQMFKQERRRPTAGR